MKIKQYLFDQTWRNADKPAYKMFDRFFGLRRFLVPIWIALLLGSMFLTNYLMALPFLLLEVFSPKLSNPNQWHKLWQSRYFFEFPNTSLKWTIFILLLSFILIYGSWQFYRLRKTFMPLEEHLTAATARWAKNPEELDEQYHTMATNEVENYSGPSGVIIATKRRTKEDIEKNRVMEYISDESTNTAIIGETRSGKGVFGVEKAIDGFSRTIDRKLKKSMVIHDPSGELYLLWKKLLEKRGYKVWLLNLVDTYISDSINPLNLVIHYYKKYLFGETEIERNRGLDMVQAELAALCYSYFSDPNAREPFWTDGASALFTAGTLALIEEALLIQKEEVVNIYTILNMIAEMNTSRISTFDHPRLVELESDKAKRIRLFEKYKDISELDFYFRQLDLGHPARIAYQDILASAPAKITIGNIVSHMLTKMKAFRRTGNAKLTSLNTINYMELGFGKQPVAIFIVVSDQDKSNHAIAANFIDQSFKELHKAGLRQPNRKLPREVVYLDEEFGNMVLIPEQATKTTDGLKVGIRHVFVLQNYEQLEKYGEHDAATIIANCGNIIVVKTKSRKTREIIIDDLGNRANLSLSRQGKIAGKERTMTDSVERIPMITKDELSRIPFGRTIVIRTMKTHDLKGNVIENLYPIYNRDKSRMLESWKYLPYEVSTWDEIDQLYLNAAHTKINLATNLYLLNTQEISRKEKRRKSIVSGTPFQDEYTVPIEKKEDIKMEKSPSVSKKKENKILPTETNESLAALEKQFNQLISPQEQGCYARDALSMNFIRQLSKEVRIFYTNEHRIIQEFDVIKESGTVFDLKNWLSNVGREPLFQKIVQLMNEIKIFKEEGERKK
ncbi:type IV secretory system conjugative DNA transfer family protein [Enterococcus faecalis]|nr:type IV secretory system conjugative DNA transfer family protein [Enterococcus faecalis]